MCERLLCVIEYRVSRESSQKVLLLMLLRVIVLLMMSGWGEAKRKPPAVPAPRVIPPTVDLVTQLKPESKLNEAKTAEAKKAKAAGDQSSHFIDCCTASIYHINTNPDISPPYLQKKMYQSQKNRK